MSSHSNVMSAERFVEYIQNCYNDNFHPDMKATMLAYLEPFDEIFISCLARVVLMRHPRQYRTAPGIAELETYSDEAMQIYKSLKQDLSIPAIEEKSELTEEQKAQVAEVFAKLKSKFYRG